MRKYKLKCSKYLVTDYFNDGKVMFKTKEPKIFYKKEDDGIIYQFQYDKNENIIDKKEWLISQSDFLLDKWSVVHYIDENIIGSQYLEIFYAYEKYCEDHKIQKIEKARIHEYLCHILTHEATFVTSNEVIDDISKNICTIYFVNVLSDGSDNGDDVLFSIDTETSCVYFYEQFYKSFNKNDNFDQVIEDNREFVKFLCQYNIYNFKQN